MYAICTKIYIYQTCLYMQKTLQKNTQGTNNNINFQGVELGGWGGQKWEGALTSYFIVFQIFWMNIMNTFSIHSDE